MSSNPTLGELLAKNSSLLTLLSSNRVKCTLTGHEMPPKADVVAQHLNSKRLKKALELRGFDFDQFLPHIVPEEAEASKAGGDEKKSSGKFLLCKLTGQRLAKIPDVIQKHVNGKKFQRLKKQFEEEEEQKRNKSHDDNDDDDDDDDDDKEGDEELDIWVPDDYAVPEKTDKKKRKEKVNKPSKLKAKKGKAVEEEEDDDDDEEEEENEEEEGEEDDYSDLIGDPDDYITTKPSGKRKHPEKQKSKSSDKHKAKR